MGTRAGSAAHVEPHDRRCVLGGPLEESRCLGHDCGAPNRQTCRHERGIAMPWRYVLHLGTVRWPCRRMGSLLVLWLADLSFADATHP